jgi:hypothetical protein
MRYFVFPGLVMLICLSLSGAQSGQHSNKPEPLAILASATFVFVEAFDGPDNPGSVRDPRVTPEDREAVENVQQSFAHTRTCTAPRDSDLSPRAAYLPWRPPLETSLE